MRRVSSNDEWKVPDGLPASFEGDEGFAQLCEFLGIANRQHKQAICRAIKSDYPELHVGLPKRLPAPQRWQKLLTRFYESATVRRQHWQKSTISSGLEHLDTWPCLEYRALCSFDQEFQVREIKQEKLHEAITAISELVQSIDIDELPDWQHSPIALWPALRRRVLEWDALNEESRNGVALALFAVATLLDDVRVLQWAAGTAAPLMREFAFAVDTPEVTPPEDDDLMGRWRDTCREAASLATDLADSPEDSAIYEVFRGRVVALEELREPTLAFVNQGSAERHIQLVIDSINDLGAEFHAAWLQKAAESIGSQWRQTYLAVASVDIEKISRDSERARRDSRAAISEWKSAIEERRQLNEQLAQIGNSIQDDISAQLEGTDRETELHRLLADVGKRIQHAMKTALTSAVPEGEKFNPKRVIQDPKNPGATSDGLEPPISTAASSSSEKSRATVDTEIDDEKASMTVAIVENEEDDLESSKELGSENDDLQARGKSTENAITPGPSGTTAPSIDSEDGTEETSLRAASNGLDAEIEVLWKTVSDRPGIAFHVTRILSEIGCDHPALPPPDLVGAAVLASHAEAGDERAVKALKEHYSRIDPEELSRVDPEVQDGLNLLLFCSSARPALVVPATGATSLLRSTQLSAALSSVYELALAIADHADRLGHGLQFDATLITAVLNQAKWSQDFETTRARARDWLLKASSQRIIYGPAHSVWIHWLREAGCLGRLARLVAEGEASEFEAVDSLRKELDESFVELVQNTSREIRGGKRRSIEGRALSQLQRHAEPLLDLAGDWQRLVEAKNHSTGFVEQSIVSLNQSVQRIGGQAVGALEHVARTTKSLQLSVSLALAEKTVKGLRDLFSDSNDRTMPIVANPGTILSRDLLFVAGIDLDSDYKPIGESLDVLTMLSDVAEHSATLEAAFDARLQRGDLVGASLACREMEASHDSTSDRCRASLDQTLRNRRIELLNVCDKHREALEQSLSFGQLAEKTAESLRGDVVSLQSDLEGAEASVSADSLERVQAGMNRIDQILQDSRRTGEAKVREKFNQLSGDCDPHARDRIERSISIGDIMTADELMSRVESGQPLDRHDLEDASDPFQDFMSAVGKIERFVADPSNSPNSIVGAVSRGEAIADLDFTSISRAEIEEASQLLEAWYRLSVAKCLDPRSQSLDTLLRAFGLPPRKLTVAESGADYAMVAMESDRIEDRFRCPLPQFGSEARGRYRILLNWARIGRESISRHIDTRRHDATIALHFGSLGEDRNWLRDWAVTQHRMFVVVDEPLALFLAGRPSGRLSALFRCVLPFSDAEPYVTTSGLVPPELFYGRSRERSRIMDSYGPCFIYGGRQLGKTALLRSVEHEFHQPDRLQVAKWIDLSVRAIGYARASAEIWPLLWHELRALGVLQQSQKEPNPASPRYADTLISAVEQWIRDDDRRRVLLLLDEADHFLADDALNDFRESTRLKGMMDRTDRRVKVVFAGLHNVLRITERANHPLAHLGEPINVGPLRTNGEWHEAHKLVKYPLQSVGYHFEPQDLSTRILAQTNYYPSLIQLYGAELVRHLRDSGRSVPSGISDEDLGKAYRSRALRTAIRERFQLTLQLDPRYEVIAYALAFELLGDGQDLSGGLERRELARHARDWWSEGFDNNDREFNVLLQELEGLGVLRSIPDTSRYTLRNLNVLLLLGSRDEIGQVLEKSRDVPKQFAPSSFHARFSDTDTTLCPLTREQESLLQKSGGVAVIAGCRAAGIDDVTRFLSKRFEGASFKILSDSLSVRTFRQKLGKLRPESRSHTTVVLVPQHEPWNVEWLVAARDALRTKKKGDRIKVLFVADSSVLWAVAKDLDGKQVESPEWIGVEPWDELFVGHWLQDNTQPHDRAHVQQLIKISGGWPRVLEVFVDQRRKRRTWDGLIEALDRELEQTDKWLAELGLNLEAKRELAALLRHQPIRSDSSGDIEAAAGVEGIDCDELRRRVRWSQRLGLLTDLDGQWQFNSLLERLLRDFVKE